MPQSPESSGNLFFVRDRDEGMLGRAYGLGNVNSKKPVLIPGLALAQFIAAGDFDDAFERAVVNLHHQEFTLGTPPSIRALAADHEPIALHRQLQIFPPHSG